MKHSIAIITDGDSKFREISKLSDLNSIFGVKQQAILMKSYGKGRERREKEEFYLFPFLSKDQLSLFDLEDHSLVLELSPNLFSILSNRPTHKSVNLSQQFVNREPIEIEAIYCGVPDSNSFIILPSCPVCLKRLDKSISGLDSIKCRDLFHSCCQRNCKSLGEDCPVCQTLFDSTGRKLSCSDCGSCENLWICLICANLGCGRYKGGHAHNHFISSGHSFALKLDSHHIWDYSMDKYVHWSIKSAEGTVVDVVEDLKATLENENIDQRTQRDFVNDFTMAQLESQKEYFENRLISTKNEHKSEISRLKMTQDEATMNLKEEIHRLNIERSVLSNLGSQYQDQIKRFRGQCASLANDLGTERKISQGLVESLDKLKNELDKSVLEREELEEQVKDLMKHIEVLDLMGKAGNIPDIVEGKLMIRPVNNKKKAAK